jgi:hypothetical protein
MSHSTSPFNWQRQPSTLSKLADFNGTNTQRSKRATSADKQPVYLAGSNVYLRDSTKQCNAFSKAKGAL